MSTKWSIEGDYMEACSCPFLCPCVAKNMTTPATYDFCKVALAFEISSGTFGDLSLDGVKFVMFAETEAVMSAGNWTSGLVVDAAASDEQASATSIIASAEGGGPLAKFGPLITDFRGVERRPIEFSKNGNQVSVKIEGMLDQAVKNACLERCRSPLGFFTQHWRPGRRGAFRMGLHHGLFCIGCCWALMLLMFVGGTMSVLAMALLCVFMLAERMLPPIAWGSVLLVQF